MDMIFSYPGHKNRKSNGKCGESIVLTYTDCLVLTSSALAYLHEMGTKPNLHDLF